MTTMVRSLKMKMAGMALAAMVGVAGIGAVEAATTTESSSASVCGYTAQSNGYAFASNNCGYAYSEVARVVGGKGYAYWSQRYKGWSSVSWTSGTRWYERTARW